MSLMSILLTDLRLFTNVASTTETIKLDSELHMNRNGKKRNLNESDSGLSEDTEGGTDENLETRQP
jgi:hypothetical protein